jgi:hypothetical protein
VVTKAVADKLRKDQEARKSQEKANEADLEKTGEEIVDVFKEAFDLMFSTSGVGENDLSVSVKDPEKRFADFEVITASGEIIKAGRRSKRSNKEGAITIMQSYETPIPADAQLKIYLLTSKSVVKVPFRFESVPLP